MKGVHKMKPYTSRVRWAELLPVEFNQRMSHCPIVYLPYGLCEPHGQISAFGLDTIKADWLCEQTALQMGGIVAPTMGYQIHEAGFHAPWLEQTVGEHNAHMTSMPPDVIMRFFLYQLRACANAGFKGIVAISGHSGGNQFDLRLVADTFTAHTGIPVFVASDPELVHDQFTGDHAGKYEISQLMYLRPELIQISKVNLQDLAGSGGRLALGDDYAEASVDHGQAIMASCLASICAVVKNMMNQIQSENIDPDAIVNYTYPFIEEIWAEIEVQAPTWRTVAPYASQPAVSPKSQWSSYAHFQLRDSVKRPSL